MSLSSLTIVSLSISNIINPSMSSSSDDSNDDGDYSDLSMISSAIEDSFGWELQQETLPIGRMMLAANVINDDIYTFGGIRGSDTGGITGVGQFEKNFDFFGTIDSTIYTDGWFVGQNEGMLWDKDNNGIYLACEDTVDSAKITRFNYITGELQTVVLIPDEFKADDCCSILYQDTIYIFGGLSPDGVELDTVLKYDLSINDGTFTQGSNIPYTRSDHTCAYSGYKGNNVVSIWGRSTDDDPNQDKYSTVQFYNLDNDNWIEYTLQPEFEDIVRRYLYPRVIWIPGTRFLLYTGGNLGVDLAVTPDDPERYSRDVYIWSLESNKFVFGDIFPKLSERRAGHSLIGSFNVVYNGFLFKKVQACLYAISGINSFDPNAARFRFYTNTYEKLCFKYFTRFDIN